MTDKYDELQAKTNEEARKYVKFHDSVNHPQHYINHPSSIECIQITEHMNFCLGNALKYIWRAGLKNDKLEDLKKAKWYLAREIHRIEENEK